MFCCVQRQVSLEEVVSRPRKKLVIVGDGECGKTCLLYRFAKDEFDEKIYIPTVFEVDVTTVHHNNSEVELVLYDTAGQEDYDRLRPFSYPDTDIVLICFSVNNPDSLENVSYNWAPEIRHFCGNVPVLLVGTKHDLRAETTDKDSVDSTKSKSKSKSAFTTVQQGEEMAYRIGAVAYIECSAKLNEGVTEVFTRAVAEAMKKKKKKTKIGSKGCPFFPVR
ncbi:ras-like GTP-binding protein rhoA [Haliotis rufescens]|uniref:ras-like GTP-binding protein rhoA n=1 Tax=Haliotis rufescens TaxID=6454 RepID=UPI001EAFFF8D|nr:ras-like GTP-binding protein rhoA [Haliotis rufescens]